MSQYFSRVLLFVVLLSFSSFVLQAQTLVPSSKVIAQPNLPTTPIDSSTSESLLTTLDKAIDSSMSTDQKLIDYEQALEQERQQRKNDNADRLKEIANWQGISETLSSQVETQQNYLSDFDKLLGNFSGSEADKHAAAVKAIDDIQKQAKALEVQNSLLKYGMIGAVAVVVVFVVIAAVK